VALALEFFAGSFEETINLFGNIRINPNALILYLTTAMVFVTSNKIQPSFRFPFG